MTSWRQTVIPTFIIMLGTSGCSNGDEEVNEQIKNPSVANVAKDVLPAKQTDNAATIESLTSLQDTIIKKAGKIVVLDLWALW